MAASFPFLAAVIVALLAPFIRAFAWGVPLSMMSWSMAIRASLGAALSTLLAGLIPLVAVPPLVAGSVALGVGLLLTALAARRQRHLRGTVLLTWRLAQDDSRDEAAALLVRRFERFERRRLQADTHAHLASIVVLPMSAIGRWKEALAILRGVRAGELSAENKGRHSQALATCLMEQGQLEDAQDVIAALDRPAEAEVERWLQALEALHFAIVGNSEEALALADAHRDAEGALGASYAIVRAHAYACDGDTKAAKKELQAVDRVAGPEGLKRAVRPVGPATELAREMLVTSGHAGFESDDA